MEKLIKDLIGRYQSLALGYIRSRVSDESAAWDIYQTAIGSLLESEKRFESLDHLRNYFFVALRNGSIDHLRRQGKESAESSIGHFLDDIAGDNSLDPETEAVLREELAQQSDRLNRLQNCLSALSDEERELMRWRFWDKKKFREIRKLTSAAISTLKSREIAALKKLKICIGILRPPS